MKGWVAPQFERLFLEPERARYCAIIAEIQVTTDTRRMMAKTTAHPVPPLLRFPAKRKAANPIGKRTNHSWPHGHVLQRPTAIPNRMEVGARCV